MAEFCANAKNYNSSHRATGDFKQLVKSKNKISYQLNAKDKFDQIILFRIGQVMSIADEGAINEMDEILDELTRLTQIWMKFEWEGVKQEAEYGNVPKEEKQQLRDKYLNQEVRNFECQLGRQAGRGQFS